MYFDIGANTGQWMRANIDLPNVSKIVCVDASPAAFKELEKTASLYGKGKVVCEFNVVTDSKEEFVRFYEAECLTLSTMNLDWLVSPESRFHGCKYSETQCPTTTIDKLIEKHGMPDLIKVDVESAEDVVMRSLTRPVPVICFEWAAEMRHVAVNTMTYLRDTLGYTKFAMQMCNDKYTFVPEEYGTFEDILAIVESAKPKLDWGMIWVRM